MTSAFERPALFARLATAKHVLLAGAGGGYDVFAAVPFARWLHARGVAYTLANVTFTYLGGTDARPRAPGLYEVTPETRGEDRYFPERALAQWLAAEGMPARVYALEKQGVRPLRAAYEALCAAPCEHPVDALLLVDGGTDLLVFGDEAGLGTPEEDAASLAALAGLPLATKLGACVGFGVDAYHGVCHAHFLENIAALERDEGYLGTFSLPRASPEGRALLDAVAFAHRAMPERPSIVHGSVCAALEGRFGDVPLGSRTAGSELFVNPLMALYFAFELEALARRSLLAPAIAQTDTIWQVSAAIEAVRKGVPHRPRRALPH